VIASGGVGNLQHIYEGLTAGRADAALAASIFHYSRVHGTAVQGLFAGTRSTGSVVGNSTTHISHFVGETLGEVLRDRGPSQCATPPKGRLSYRALKREFVLDDEALEDLRQN